MEITSEFIEMLEAQGSNIIAYCEEEEQKQGSLIITTKQKDFKILQVISAGLDIEGVLNLDDIILVQAFNCSLLLKVGKREWYWLNEKSVIAKKEWKE